MEQVKEKTDKSKPLKDFIKSSRTATCSLLAYFLLLLFIIVFHYVVRCQIAVYIFIVLLAFDIIFFTTLALCDNDFEYLRKALHSCIIIFTIYYFIVTIKYSTPITITLEMVKEGYTIPQADPLAGLLVSFSFAWMSLLDLIKSFTKKKTNLTDSEK